jgi:hypothetical protein
MMPNFSGIVGLIYILGGVCVVSVPLGLWKMVELLSNISISWG